jgi:SAM-dependent methyltransferase
MPASDVAAFVRAALPEPPARVLEIGAGSGELAALLRDGGYDVLAIDPAGGDVVQLALHEVAEPAGSFDAAVAVVSLHHVEPLAESLRRLAELLRPGAPLVVDEFDIERFDERAAAWLLAQRAAAGDSHDAKRPGELVADLRAHLHPVSSLVSELSPHFDVGSVVPGPYLHRWDLDAALRPVEEQLIAAGALPATGARFVATARSVASGRRGSRGRAGRRGRGV